METTAEQDKVITDWFNKWKPVCQVCGGKKWIQNASLGSFQSLSSDDARVEINKHMPVVLLICDNCSNTISISAIHAGVVGPDAGGE